MATYDLKYPGAAIDAILDTAYDLQNAGYIFRGLASEYSNTPTERSWVLAGEGETGHGFTTAIPKGYIGVCVFDGTSWTGKLVKCVSIDSTPTPGSTNAVSSGGAYAAINQLATGVAEALDNLTFTDITPSADQGTKLKWQLATTDAGVQRILTDFTFLSATTSKAGLLSAADKAKLDAILGNLRSLEIDDTTAYADLGDKIVESIKATIEGTEETISTFQLLAATASKAGLLSAADKTKLDALWSSGYQFVGIATPSTTPVSTTSKIFYIATEAGTYFNAVTVTQGINILSWDGSAWNAVQVIGIDDEPTADSLNLPRSGGVYNWIRDIGSKANSVYGEYFLDLSHVFDSSRYSYERSNLYDTAWVCLLKGSAKITVTGATVTTIRYFSSFDELNESTSIETNTSGIVPEGAKLAHVILKKENNTGGYDNMIITQYDLLDNVNDFISKGLFFHPDHLIANTGGTGENARYQASSLWDCFHVVINGQYRINIEGLNEGTTYRFYNDMNIFDGELVFSRMTGSNTTGIVPEGSAICVVNTPHSNYPNGYANFRLINDYTDFEHARLDDMAINKGFYIDKNHIVSVNSGVVKYEKNNDWDTLVVFTEGAKKIHVNGLNDGANYRFFDSADIFTGEDIAEHLIERNTTGVVPDGAVVSINSFQHSTYPDGYADFSIEKEYGNDDMKAINMLLIGNSAAQDAIAYVPFILQNMGLTNVRIGLLMQSDSTIQMHVDNFTNESSVYTFYLFNSGSSWTSSSAKSIQWALDNYQWDIVLFHQGANRSTSQYDGSIQPYLNQIANLISAYVDYGVKFVFYQNQSRPGASNRGANWSDEVITQHYEKTVLYCQNILNETIFEAIVPVGTAVQNARTIPALKALGDYANESANTSGLGYLTYDGIHLQEGLPSQLAAYTFVLFLLDIYGMKEMSINGENTRATSEWTQGKSIPGPHGECVGATDENCLIAQKCAIMAIKNPFEVTDMNYIINPTEIQTT